MDDGHAVEVIEDLHLFALPPGQLAAGMHGSRAMLTDYYIVPKGVRIEVSLLKNRTDVILER
jgi:hypothetical protein